MSEETEITWDPEADRRIRRSPLLMRRFIRKRIGDVDESAKTYRQYRFKCPHRRGERNGIRPSTPDVHKTIRVSPRSVSALVGRHDDGGTR